MKHLVVNEAVYTVAGLEKDPTYATATETDEGEAPYALADDTYVMADGGKRTVRLKRSDSEPKYTTADDLYGSSETGEATYTVADDTYALANQQSVKNSAKSGKAEGDYAIADDTYAMSEHASGHKPTAGHRAHPASGDESNYAIADDTYAMSDRTAGHSTASSQRANTASGDESNYAMADDTYATSTLQRTLSHPREKGKVLELDPTYDLGDEDAEEASAAPRQPKQFVCRDMQHIQLIACTDPRRRRTLCTPWYAKCC